MFVQSVQFPTFQAISIFLQIWLDDSNYHILPATLYPNEAINRCKKSSHACAPYNFLHFSQQYTVHILARREKNRARFFSCARVRITTSSFSPANMCIYIIGSRGANEYGGFAGSWRLELTMDISYLGRI